MAVELRGDFLTVQGSVTNDNGEALYVYYEVRCANKACVVPEGLQLSAYCEHVRALRSAGGDRPLMRRAADKSGRHYNAVLAPLKHYTEKHAEAMSMKASEFDRSINFGIIFPERFLHRRAENLDERAWGDLVIFRPVSGVYAYDLTDYVEEDVVYSRPYDMTTKAVRAIGLNWLAEKYFSGIQCPSPNHSILGHESLATSERRVSDGHHKNIRVLNDVAHIYLDQECFTCKMSATLGLADF